MGGGQECGHRGKTELLAPGREICYCEDVGRRTAYHLSMKKKKRGGGGGGGGETVRQGYRRRQMERGGG